MVFDGQDFDGILKVESISRSILPTVTVDAPSWGGEASVTLEPLEIEVGVRAFSPVSGTRARRFALEEARRRVAGMLGRDGLRKLVLDDAPDAWYMAAVSGRTDLERIAHTQGATITFLCPDPRAHGMRRTVDRPDGGDSTVSVGGNASTAPVVTVSCGGSALAMAFDGAQLRTTVAVEGEVIVDAVSHTCLTPGGVAVPVHIEDDYPEWEPGTHVISCDLPYSAWWEERWL